MNERSAVVATSDFLFDGEVDLLLEATTRSSGALLVRADVSSRRDEGEDDFSAKGEADRMGGGIEDDVSD